MVSPDGSPSGRALPAPSTAKSDDEHNADGPTPIFIPATRIPSRPSPSARTSSSTSAQRSSTGRPLSTIRLVEDSEIYTRNPYPTQPSQILSPSVVGRQGSQLAPAPHYAPSSSSRTPSYSSAATSSGSHTTRTTRTASAGTGTTASTAATVTPASTITSLPRWRGPSSNALQIATRHIKHYSIDGAELPSPLSSNPPTQDDHRDSQSPRDIAHDARPHASSSEEDHRHGTSQRDLTSEDPLDDSMYGHVLDALRNLSHASSPRSTSDLSGGHHDDNFATSPIDDASGRDPSSQPESPLPVDDANYEIINASDPSTMSRSSTASSENPRPRPQRYRRPSYSAFPAPPSPSGGDSRRTSLGPLTPVRANSRRSQDAGVNKRVASSSSSSSGTKVTARRSKPAPPKLQYPVVKPAIARGSWADSTISIPKRPKLPDAWRRSRPWSTELSTVASESDRGSISKSEFGRELMSPTLPAMEESPASQKDQAPEPPKRNSTRRYHNMDKGKQKQTIRTVSAPRDSTYSTYSNGDQLEDMRAPQIRRRRSSSVYGQSVMSRSSSTSDMPNQPGSRQSYTAAVPNWARDYYSRDEVPDHLAAGSRQSYQAAVPNWARNYYSRNGKDIFPVEVSGSDEPSPPSVSAPTMPSLPSTARSGSPTASPASIYHPRKRPHQIITVPSSERMAEVSSSTGEWHQDDEITQAPPLRRDLVTSEWTPRLQRDRQSARLSVWEVPPVDPKSDESWFSPRGFQVMLFCLGFICPFSWMTAACLPLPAKPAPISDEKAGRTDLEKALEHDVGPYEAMQYENARWWRFVNRIMSVIGFFILATAVALVVVAARVHNTK